MRNICINPGIEYFRAIVANTFFVRCRSSGAVCGWTKSAFQKGVEAARSHFNR